MPRFFSCPGRRRSPTIPVVASNRSAVLVGRQEECRLIDDLLAGAAAGRSAAVVIRGEPGIGKTALLQYARDHAEGVTLLGARGVEAEAELAFATLHELLRPTLRLLPDVPSPQAAALASALALGPPVPSDRFAVGAATLSLLAAAAEERPLLALLDDVHWADPSSREALLFAARRLRAEGVVLLLAVRAVEDFAMSGVAEVTLAPLSPGACRQLVSDARGREVAAAVADRLFSVTGGNPLALIQLAALLTDDQLVGRQLLPDPLPAVDVEAAFLARVAELPAQSQRALVVAATSESGAMDEIVAAARVLGLRADDLAAGEETRLITIESGALRFQHPLLRSALYHSAATDERRAAHRALANALGAKQEAERRFWHLAAAATAPDEGVAAGLEQAAACASRRSDHAAAAAAFERAARLTPHPRVRAVRLVAAAEAALFAGRFDLAAGLLDEAFIDIPDDRRADAVRLRAAADLWRGRAKEARHLLVGEAARVGEDDPARAAVMLADAAVPSIMALDVEAAIETAVRAQVTADRANADVQAIAIAVAGACFVVRGDVNEGRRLLERVRPLVEQTHPSAVIPPLIRHFVWHLYIILGWYADAERLFDATIHSARAAGAPGLLPFPLAFRAELGFRTGRWHSAYVDASESALLAEQTGQWTQVPHSLAVLARIEAGRGDGDACRRHCTRALELAQEQGSDAIRLYTAMALGLLELGRGRSAQAIAELEPAARLSQSRGASPADVPSRPELIEAYTRAGRIPDALQMLAPLERWAAENNDTWILAGCARCRGLLAPDEELDAWFVEAIRRHDQTTTAFERARTQLCYGERLRRAKRIVDAREPLRSALAAFEGLAARPWTERAQTELRASRDVPRERRGPAVADLTPQEFQVAQIVAEGATNREAAAALFLSPKTIDFHLRNIYRKLALRSRTDLARVLPDALKGA